MCSAIETVVFLGCQNVRGHRDDGILGGAWPPAPPLCIRHWVTVTNKLTPEVTSVTCHFTHYSAVVIVTISRCTGSS